MYTFKEYCDMYDQYFNQAVIWLLKRRRYRMIKLTSVIMIDRQENYACFKAIRDISYITLYNFFILIQLYITFYKKQMIEYYMKNPIVNSKSFKAFFVSTIAHELTHRKQWLYDYNKSYTKYLKAYKENSESFEKEAMYVELRLWKNLK